MTQRIKREGVKEQRACPKWLLIILVTISTLHYSDALYTVRRPCERSWDGAHGICVPLSECPDLRSGGTSDSKIHRPDLCEPYGRVPVVCCVPKKPLSSEEVGQALSLSPSILDLTAGLHEPLWRQKCREYAKLVYGEDGTSESEPQAAECTQSTLSSAGRAGYGEIPHMAAIGYGTTFLCGGSLISERYVMTAAHCVFGRYVERAEWVLLGSVFLNQSATDPTRQQIPISQLIMYPDYKRTKFYFDVALVQLKSSARLGPFVRPACLSSDRTTSALELTIAGWGRTSQSGAPSGTLLKTKLVQVPFEECSAEFGTAIFPSGLHNASVICAGHPHSKSGSCQGDSGGPLQVVSSDFYCMYEVIGITSLGKGCGSGTPVVYSRVAFFRSWIEDIVWG